MSPPGGGSTGAAGEGGTLGHLPKRPPSVACGDTSPAGEEMSLRAWGRK